jgi:RHS repeat-associated protein
VDTAIWKLPVANGTHAVAIMCGDADSRAHTNNLMINGVSLVDATPYDGLVTLGYEPGSFDGYALTVNVTDGFVTIQAGAGALDPKINFIEIAPVGTVIDTPTSARVQAAAVQATHDTAKPKAKVPPVVKRNVWGVYVDELVSYTTQKPRHAPARYYTYSNHLYSIAATTNAAGSVVEHYSYNAYGVQTVRNSAGVTLAKSTVGNDHRFTGYKLDAETGMYFARARMYSSKLGRFVSRDPSGYVDGYQLYRAFFAPSGNDPSGEETRTETDTHYAESGWRDSGLGRWEEIWHPYETTRETDSCGNCVRVKVKSKREWLKEQIAYWIMSSWNEERSWGYSAVNVASGAVIGAAAGFATGGAAWIAAIALAGGAAGGTIDIVLSETGWTESVGSRVSVETSTISSRQFVSSGEYAYDEYYLSCN